ncbi:thiamine pyrophosphate-binding protein, partial [Methylobacterium hispanicum]
MRITNVADLVVETLQEAGVRRIFGVVGDSLNAITESIRARGTIDWIHVRHEEAGAFAAGAESQITGGLAVCAGS